MVDLRVSLCLYGPGRTPSVVVACFGVRMCHLHVLCAAHSTLRRCNAVPRSAVVVGCARPCREHHGNTTHVLLAETKVSVLSRWRQAQALQLLDSCWHKPVQATAVSLLWN